MKRFSENNNGSGVNATVTEIESMSKISVEDCCGVEISEYDEDTLKITTKRIVMRIIGRKLMLSKLTQCCIVIDGDISSVEFEHRGASR